MKSHRLISWEAALCAAGIAAVPLFSQVAPTPPMGWNSYDCWNYAVEDSQFLNNAHYVNTRLKQHGWQYVVVDFLWSCPKVGTGLPNQNASFIPRLNMDQYGRLLPDTVRFPSARGGAGFRRLADSAHAMGLKFGIHLMRGIPRQAVNANTPVQGTAYTASQAANTGSTCSWCNHMYGMNMANPAGQAYLNSIFNLYASWGVDFVKVDDLSQPYYTSEIVGYRTAINQCGRQMVFSTSPGETPTTESAHISQYANMWRLLGDLWDNWGALDHAFDVCAAWADLHVAGPDHWPDPDMLPLGRLSKYGPVGNDRYTAFTRDEQYSLMSLWCISRSPLMYGGNLPENRLSDDSLITNDEAIAVNQGSTNSRLVMISANFPVWAADHPDSANVKYLGVFNRTAAASTVTVSLASLGIRTCAVRNLWTKTNLGNDTVTFAPVIPAHGSGLYRLTVIDTAPLPQVSEYEAESAANTRTGTAVVANVATASNGQVVGYVGNGAGNTLQFNAIQVPAAGTYTVIIYYLTGENRTAGMSVNGGTATTVSFPSTGSFTTVGTIMVTVNFNAGNNTIRFSNSTYYTPDFDKIAVEIPTAAFPEPHRAVDASKLQLWYSSAQNTLHFSLPGNAPARRIEVVITDIKGRLLKRLSNKLPDGGPFSTRFDSKVALPAGIYLVAVHNGDLRVRGMINAVR